MSARDVHFALRELVDGVLVATWVRPELHNTHHCYANYGCRCKPCTAANTAFAARMRENRLRRRVLRDGRWHAPDEARHGRYGTYVNWGCRCRPCTDANARRELSRRHRQ